MNHSHSIEFAFLAKFVPQVWLVMVLPLICAAETGPLIWRDMDQAALDAAYDQSVYAPNLEQVLSRFTSNSVVARSVLGEPEKYQYGTTEIETLDVFKTEIPNAPIHVFIHGGAWKFGSAGQNSFLAENFLHSGVHFVAPDFSSVVEQDGNLAPLVDQLRAAMVWIHKHLAQEIGGDPNRIYLSGFSSGGHLAGVLVTTDWNQFEGIPPDLIKGAILCSGMYDLYPVSLSSRRDYVDFTPQTIEAFSPLRHIENVRCPLVVAYGTYETPEFKRQAQEFSDSVTRDGKSVKLLIGENYNHFEMIETLASPYGLLGRAVLEQMQVSP
jgi:arylformamidase